MGLTVAEERLATAIGFDTQICELVKVLAGNSLTRLVGFTEKYEQTDAPGLSVAVARDDVEPILQRLQPELLSRNYRAFWSEIYAANGGKASDEIAVLRTTDEFFCRA